MNLTHRKKSRKNKTHTILVATSAVDQTIKLHPEAPRSIRIRSGQSLILRFDYQLRKDSRERENYRFTLRSELDGQPAVPAHAQWGDRWGYPDDIHGHIEHRHEAPTQPGEHLLHYEVLTEYQVSGWSGAELVSVQEESHEGIIRIIIH